MNTPNRIAPDRLNLTHGALQDIHHYCLVICPLLNRDQESTFAGDSRYKNLAGGLRCYSDLLYAINRGDLYDYPAFAALHVPNVSEIPDYEQLRGIVSGIFRACTEISDANNFDAFLGEPKPTPRALQADQRVAAMGGFDMDANGIDPTYRGQIEINGVTCQVTGSRIVQGVLHFEFCWFNVGDSRSIPGCVVPAALCNIV